MSNKYILTRTCIHDEEFIRHRENIQRLHATIHEMYELPTLDKLFSNILINTDFLEASFHEIIMNTIIEDLYVDAVLDIL